MSKVTIRPATTEDFLKFWEGNGPTPTFRAVAGEKDGEVIGVGGAALINGRWICFCDLTEEARKHKMTLARAAIRFFDDARKDGIRFIYAGVEEAEPRAREWVASLGFRRKGAIYRWRA